MGTGEAAARPLRGSGAAIYVIDGRVLIRTVDLSGGVERARPTSATVLDGFPDVTAAKLGESVMRAAAESQEIPAPPGRPKASEFNATLLAETEDEYKSFRVWQRAARYVNVLVRADRWQLTRLHPDLKGGWTPARDSDAHHAQFAQEIDLQLYADAEEVGEAVLQLLEEPSLREAIGH